MKPRSSTPTHYSKASLVAAFKSAGLREGQVVYSHSNIGNFGIPEEGNDRHIASRVVLDAFLEVLGPGGTLVVPTYTYSFCKQQIFDPDATPSTCGPWSEFVRLQPDAIRSHDPIFSVAAIGAKAQELTRDMPQECFGPDSIWDRLLKNDAIVCNLNLWVVSTFIHYVEKTLNVPYRFDKLFTGTISHQGVQRQTASIYFCQDLTNEDTRVYVRDFDELALASGLALKVPAGRGWITAMSAANMTQLIRDTLPSRPEFLIEAGRKGIKPLLLRTTQNFTLALPPQASMREMVEALWSLPRDIVSDAYDAALQALAQQVPMTIHTYPTGTHAWTWLVPEKWTCHEARLETMDGHVLFSYADNPLHVVSYSLPFNGVVSREELFNHLHVHPHLPDAIVFMFKYYDRDWGLCCSQNLRDSLNDSEYRVTIRSEFSYGELKVGEVFVQGQTDDCIVLCAHLCHPGQVADDLSGVVAGIQIMRTLMQRTDLHYSYRLLILPETIGSVTWLSQNEHLIPQMKGGLFLEMLSLPYPSALQLSFKGDTFLDQCFSQTLQTHDPEGWIAPFRHVVGNDERQFNAPGIRVPMLSLSRVLKPGVAQRPYPQYHSSQDNPDNASWRHLDDSVKLVLSMIDALEALPCPQASPLQSSPRLANVPENLFKGEIFCSRFGLQPTFSKDRAAHRAFFDILYLIDGQNSIAEIARIAGTTEVAVELVLSGLAKHGLVA